MAQHAKKKFCSRCGKSLKVTDRFCPACGSKGSRKSVRPPKSNKKQNWILITGTGIVLAFVIAIIVIGWPVIGLDSVNLDRNDPQIASIAAEFDCSCGECNKALQICGCPTAKDMYKYIYKQVKTGQYSHLEMIKKVNDRYGYLKNKSILDK